LAPIAKKTLVILLGGKSSRMGQDKSELILNGRPVLERIFDEVKPYFEEIILSTNKPEIHSKYGFECVRDEAPDQGPAGGLLSVMNACPREFYQLVPCDTPFLSGAVAAHILEMSAGYDAGIVITPDGPQPLFSAYSFSARDALRENLQRDVFRIVACIKNLNIRKISHADLGLDKTWEKHFFNMNHIDDLERAMAMDKSHR
jgi:molybdenum cofactor guanylyltransferase